MHALIDVFLGVMAFCAFVGGIVPFLWFFLPEFRSGFGTSREAQEWGAYCLKRNKRTAPQICADFENPQTWR
jgi:hypothetical protein